MWSLYERAEPKDEEDEEEEEEIPFRERERRAQEESARKRREEEANESSIERADRKRREREAKRAAEAEAKAKEKAARAARGSDSSDDSDDSDDSSSGSEVSSDSEEDASDGDSESEAQSLDSVDAAAAGKPLQIALKFAEQRLAFARLLLQFRNNAPADAAAVGSELLDDEERPGEEQRGMGVHVFVDSDGADVGGATITSALVSRIGSWVGAPEPTPEPEPEPEPAPRLSAQQKAAVREEERAAKAEAKRVKAEAKAARKAYYKEHRRPCCLDLRRPAPVWTPGHRHAAIAVDARGHLREVPAPNKFSAQVLRELPWCAWSKCRCPRLRAELHNNIVCITRRSVGCCCIWEQPPAGVLTVDIVSETPCCGKTPSSACLFRHWRACCTKTVRTIGPEGHCMKCTDPVKGGCTKAVFKDFLIHMWTCWYVPGRETEQQPPGAKRCGTPCCHCCLMQRCGHRCAGGCRRCWSRPRSLCRFPGFVYFLWLAGGLFHCGHLHLLMWVGPRLDPETGRFLHRRIVQHYAGLGLMSLLYWAVTHIRLPDPIDHTVYYTGAMPCADGEYMSRRCLFDVQPNYFAALWVLMIMAGTWTTLQWLFDSVCLWRWCVQTVDGVALSSFGMPSSARCLRKACGGESAVTGWGAATNRAPIRDGLCGSATVMETLNMLGVLLLTASWTIFLPWTTGPVEDLLSGQVTTDQYCSLEELLRGAIIFLVCWAWGICAALRCPCGLRKKHLVCILCCVRDPTICPWLFDLKRPKLQLKRRMRRLKVRIGRVRGDDSVVSFSDGNETQWSDLGDDKLGVEEWLRSNGPVNTAQLAAQICSVLENEGCTSAEWLTELQAKSATELEELIAAAMASDDLKNNNAITSPGVSQEAHAHSRWVLPDAAKTQLKNAQQDAEEQAVQMWTPLTIDIDHVALDGGTTGRIPREGTEADSVHPWRRDKPTVFRKAVAMQAVPLGAVEGAAVKPGVVTANPESKFNREQLAVALRSDTAKPFAAGVYGFTAEGYPMGAAVGARSPLRQTTAKELFHMQDAYRADPRNRAWVEGYKQDGWQAPKGWRVCYGKGQGWCERTQIGTWPLQEVRPLDPPNERRPGWKGWLDRRNVRRLGEEPPVVGQPGQTTSSFQTTTHNPYDSDSLSSDDSEYEAQLNRRAERNERREQEEKDRIAAEHAAAAIAQEQAYPHELDADNVQQVAGMFAVEEPDAEKTQETDEQRDADTRTTIEVTTGLASIADVEEGKDVCDIEAEASAAMQQMRDELEALEKRKMLREHNLADGTDWVDPAMDGRKVEVEMTSAKQRDDQVRVQAVAEFAPLQLGDLGFSAGEVLVVTDMSTPWWIGYRDGQPEQKGTFPSNYVKQYTDEKANGGRSTRRDGWKDTMVTIELPSSIAGP